MTEAMITDPSAAAECFVDWLGTRVIERARGDQDAMIDGKPDDRFWLGRLAPTRVAGNNSAARLERLEPCAIGIRLRPGDAGPWSFEVGVRFAIWRWASAQRWSKLPMIDVVLPVTLDGKLGTTSHGGAILNDAIRAVSGRSDLTAEVVCEVSGSPGEIELLVSLVNTSPLDDDARIDFRFYQCAMELSGLATRPFTLDSLEDTFRYDRTVPAYGFNCGVDADGAVFRTNDAPRADKARPNYWGGEHTAPDLRFAHIANDPVGAADALATAVAEWGKAHWSSEILDTRAETEAWTTAMRKRADVGRKDFEDEVLRIRAGADLLRADAHVRRAFVLMNRAMITLGERRDYDRWRPFQFGFLMANLSSLLEHPDESSIVDIVWFATGGGKTETYLGLLMTAAFRDRLRGKTAGVTAWSRFPLRLLSLQQMQRFADAMAAAEIVRRDEGLGGAPFSVGFLVGDTSTPNKLRRREDDPDTRYDPDDDVLMARFRMLQQCPFCGSSDLKVKFDSGAWRLDHRCTNKACQWPERGLPFHIVDEEVFRTLPTIIVGTLDKAASIGMQQAMRGLVGPPRGRCPTAGHGFTYNRSGRAPKGCLVPGCTADPAPLDIDGALIPPTYRLQDELHLLRDTLGAIDAHYEAALDGLQHELTGRMPKILASSATLAGYEKQSHILYRREARVFPQPPPAPNLGLWSRPSSELMRRYLAIAPRGATIEFAVDRLINELQCAVRELRDDPEPLCTKLGIDPGLAEVLLSQYGTDVVFGNTLRDLNAVIRSGGTQLVDIPGPVNQEMLTGQTGFENVSTILDRLQKTDETKPFDDRIHVITASSMMSHGVDVDRLNIMIVLGVPITTAEFIQATARVGRKWPSLVFVVHKIGRERDASVYRSFEKFVEQGDRLVEPIPITGRSRRVLARTLPGLETSRMLHVHAPTYDQFTTVRHTRPAIQRGALEVGVERDAVVGYVGYDATRESEHIQDVQAGIERYFDRMQAPTTKASTWIGKCWPRGPMNSLRDVEEQVVVHLRRGK